MAMINSVLGPIDAADLGCTLTHEHIFVGPAGSYRDFPELLGPNAFEQVIDGLKKAKDGCRLCRPALPFSRSGSGED